MLDLLVRSPDVLRREGEHGQDADADFEAPFEDLLEFVPAFHMSIEDVPEADLPSEPTVPIHDDRHVMRHGGQFDLMQEPAFVGLIGGITDDLGDVRRHLGMRRMPTYLAIRGDRRYRWREAPLAVRPSHRRVRVPAPHPQTFKYAILLVPSVPFNPFSVV